MSFYICRMERFSAKIEKIGVNPYVLLPVKVLNAVFVQAGKDKGPIPVCGTINGKKFIQTLVKYSGKWRLYINGPMLQAGQAKLGDTIQVEIAHDPLPREVPVHQKLKAALNKTPQAKKTFDALPPSRQKEIARYIHHLKTEESVDRNIAKAIAFLLGKGRFAGREP